MTRLLIDLGRRRPTLCVEPLAAALLALVLTYGTVGWVNVLHQAAGASEPGEPSPLIHTLRDGTLAIPMVLTAVWLAMLACRRVVARLGAEPATAAATALLAILCAGAVSAALGVGTLLHGATFGGHHHEQLPWALHMVRDGTVGFPVALLLAAIVSALMARRRPWLAPATDRWRMPTSQQARMALQFGVALLAVAPAAVFASSAAEQAVAGAGPGTPCPGGVPVRSYNIQAINVDIPLNRFGDHDPLGKMYAPTDKIAAVRAQERSRKVSIGLRTDPIQPLVIRANEGDCVEITFTNNASGGSYGMHIDGLAFETGSSGDAVGLNTPSSVARGQTTLYRYFVPKDSDLEGTHYIRPGPGFRTQVAHGLFGALEVEPEGSEWFKPDNTDPADPNSRITSGWEAVIKPGDENAKSFREFVSIYHEIGDESFKIPNYSGNDIPFVDPHTSAYRPASRAINYRTEPFFNRLQKAGHQKSLSYNSYTFGDPSTPWMRSYVGEPTKIRLLHGGGEMFHVYHLHGGGIRWRYSPKADSTFDYAETGIKKVPVRDAQSTRLDSQSIGPGEAYTLEIEGGAGGVNQTVGDLLEHCHIAEHYNAGMWRFWRVYNTLQPDLAPLRDKNERFYNHPPEAVSSAGLIGLKMPDGTTITKENLATQLAPYLPPQGLPQSDQDGSVWNWAVDNSNPNAPLYLGEPEDRGPWPDLYDGAHPGGLPGDQYVGNRPVIKFNPQDGRPAFPLLRPHIGQRAPQSPNGHTGTPFLGPTTDAQKSTPSDVPDPYANHPDGLCPQNSPHRTFNMTEVELPIKVTRGGATDPTGAVFVLNKDKADVLAGRKPAVPLAIRSNIGDCDNVTLVSEMTDTNAFGGFAKSNLHIHHVQFDIQGSDGASAGFVFDQSVRPYKLTDVQLAAPAAVGATTISVTNAAKFQVGVWIAVGEGTEDIEVRQIKSISGQNLELDKPLAKAHAAGQWSGTEFHQERWYPDVALDNVFWHDHVDGIHGWGKGLVGQLIIEPRGSTYHDPRTGAQVDSGELVDIHVAGGESVAPGVQGGFRELALWTIDDNPATDSTLNLRAEPFSDRSGDASLTFSSYKNLDPFTILPRAYPGDPFVIRTINVSGDGIDTLRFDGHRFRIENRYVGSNGQPGASLVDTLHYGVSERFTAILDGGAGGPNRRAGDYLFMNGLARRFRQGAWGILRVLPSGTATLQPLPGRPAPPAGTLPTTTGKRPPAASGPGNPCPAGAPKRSFAVSAVDLPIGVRPRAAFVPTADAASVASGSLKPEPLVLHAAVGECVEVTFRNQRVAPTATAGVPLASFHVAKLDRTVESSGVDVGFNPEQTVNGGAQRLYRYYVDKDIGSATIADFGDIRSSGKQGLYGAVVTAPSGSTFTDPSTGAADDVGSQVVVQPPSGEPAYRDVTLMFSDDDARIGQNTMPYPTKVEGPAEINYRKAGPFADDANMFSSIAHGADPPTPLVRAYAGDPIHFHVIGTPGSEQGHNLTLGGLSWNVDPRIPHSDEVQDQGFGPWESLDVDMVGGAGGRGHVTGDFAYGDLRRPFTQAGMWGLIRVVDPADLKPDLLPLG